MPVIPVYVGRVDVGTCSGMIYSYEPIAQQTLQCDNELVRIRPISSLQIQTPDGFELELVHHVNPYGDTDVERMVYDPIETERGESGRVYMRAARLFERMRSGTGEFVPVG